MGEEMTDVEKLERRIEKLEKMLERFMSKWGPETQKRRDERDGVWDEMVKVVSIQTKNKK